MKMRYVSNAGIILEAEEASIGIDCFCRDENGIYCDIAPEVKAELLEEIEKGNIGALIFTHEHSDHFNAEDVKEACARNKKLKVCAGKRVIERLQQEGVASEQLIEVCAMQELTQGDIQVQFIETLHDGDQYAGVQNLTLLINIGRKSIVVTGDAEPRKELFAQIRKWSEHVDLLIAPFPYVGLRTARKAICENLDVKQIFVLHQPKKEADVQNWVANTKKVCEQAKDGLPAPIFPEKPGEWYDL